MSACSGWFALPGSDGNLEGEAGGVRHKVREMLGNVDDARTV